MQNTMLDAACAGIRAVCVANPAISTNKLELIEELVKNPLLTDDLIERVREIVRNHEKAVEPPMSCDEAAHLLNISKAALHYHIRAGRIRRVTVPGASRGRGVVAADVRRILNGEAA